jgi:hypothetical protein
MKKFTDKINESVENKIPTSEEFAERNQYDLESHDEGGYLGIDTKIFAENLIEFAKLHVEAALKEASEKVSLTDFAYEFLQEGAYDAIDKDTILNSYSLDNIK